MSTTDEPTKEQTIALINALLDEIKERHGLSSDYALSQHLGIAQVYITRWRTGGYNTALRILAAPLVEFGKRQVA